MRGRARRSALGTAVRAIRWLSETKNGLPREVKLSANADAAIARRWTLGATGLVFGSRNWNTFRSSWAKAVRAAGIVKFRFHDLRHTTASWLVQQGRTLLEVKTMLGHSDIAVTLRYSPPGPGLPA